MSYSFLLADMAILYWVIPSYFIFYSIENRTISFWWWQADMNDKRWLRLFEMFNSHAKIWASRLVKNK